MGYLKHVFGDDMNAEEIARLEHAELWTQMHSYSGLIGIALHKHHDRVYGTHAECTWCQEPQREKTAEALGPIEAAFSRPSAEPQPKKPPEPEAPTTVEPQWHTFRVDQAFLRAIYAQLFDSQKASSDAPKDGEK